MSKGSMRTGMCAAQPLEQGLCKAVYYFFLEEYDMPCAGLRTPCQSQPAFFLPDWAMPPQLQSLQKQTPINPKSIHE